MAQSDGTGKETVPVQTEKNRTQNGYEKIQVFTIKYIEILTLTINLSRSTFPC